MPAVVGCFLVPEGAAELPLLARLPTAARLVAALSLATLTTTLLATLTTTLLATAGTATLLTTALLATLIGRSALTLFLLPALLALLTWLTLAGLILVGIVCHLYLLGFNFRQTLAAFASSDMFLFAKDAEEVTKGASMRRGQTRRTAMGECLSASYLSQQW